MVGNVSTYMRNVLTILCLGRGLQCDGVRRYSPFRALLIVSTVGFQAELRVKLYFERMEIMSSMVSPCDASVLISMRVKPNSKPKAATCPPT